MKCFTRAFLGFAAAFWFTLAFAPRVRQALINYSERPLPREWEAPKYEIGGRRVTKEEFEAWPPAPVTDPQAHVDQFGKGTA